MKRWQKISGVIALAILTAYEWLVWVNAQLDLKYIFTPYGAYDIDNIVVERAHLRMDSLSALMWLNMVLVIVLFVRLWKKGGKR